MKKKEASTKKDISDQNSKQISSSLGATPASQKVKPSPTAEISQRKYSVDAKPKVIVATKSKSAGDDSAMELSFSSLAKTNQKHDISQSFSQMKLQHPTHHNLQRNDMDASMSMYRDSIVEISSDEEDNDNIDEYESVEEGDHAKQPSGSDDDDGECFIDAVEALAQPKSDSVPASKPTETQPKPVAPESKSQQEMNFCAKPSILVKTQDGHTVSVPAQPLKTVTTNSGYRVITVARPPSVPEETSKDSGFVLTQTYKNLQKDIARKTELTRVLEQQRVGVINAISYLR